MGNLICPTADSCPVYKNWVEETNDRRLDVIMVHPATAENQTLHNCLALIALQDPTSEGGIMPNEEIKERLKIEEANCLYIRLLNQNSYAVRSLSRVPKAH